MVDYALLFSEFENSYAKSAIWTTKMYDFSMTFWIRRTDPQGTDPRNISFEYIASNADSVLNPRRGWWLTLGGIGGSNCPYRIFFEHNSTLSYWSITYDIDLGVDWTHVGIVFTKSGNNWVSNCYLNGVLHRTRTGSVIGTAPYESDNSFISRSSEALTNGMNRTFLKSFRLWDRALSGEEIATDMGSSTPNSTDLKVWYPFDDGSGTQLRDASGNGKNATLYGNPTWYPLTGFPYYIFDDLGQHEGGTQFVNRFWNAVYGTATNSHDKKMGHESYQVVLSNQLLDIYVDHPITASGTGSWPCPNKAAPYTSRDYNPQGKNRINFWFYGANTGRTITLRFAAEPRATVANYFEKTFVDNFTGWQFFSWSQSLFTITGSPSWTSIRHINFYSDGTMTGTIKLDAMFVDSPPTTFKTLTEIIEINSTVSTLHMITVFKTLIETMGVNPAVSLLHMITFFKTLSETMEMNHAVRIIYTILEFAQAYKIKIILPPVAKALGRAARKLSVKLSDKLERGS